MKYQRHLQLLKLLPSLAAGCMVALLLTGSASQAAPGWVTSGELARKFALEERREGLSGRVILRGHALELVICPGMQLASLNGETITLSERVRYRDEEVLIPADILSQVSHIISPPPLRIISRTVRLSLRVVLDAGHGGADPGAIGPTGVREKDVNLAITRKLARLLEAKGVEVILTREDDHYITLEERSNIANRDQPDFFVSIHCNAFTDRYVEGFECYTLSEEFLQTRNVSGFMGSSGEHYDYQAGRYDDGKRAQIAARHHSPPARDVGEFSGDALSRLVLWNLLLEEYRQESRRLAASIQNHLARRLNSTTDRGVKTAGFSVLKWTYVPAVLVEVGFLSHRRWESWLNSGWMQDTIAEALCQAVLEAAGHPPSGGLVRP